jgi:hypothetical protein
VEVRIGLPDGELPVDATASSLATRIPPRVQSAHSRAGRRVVNEAPQRIGSSLRLSQHAFSPTSNTHNIAARSLGRGMPPVEPRPGMLPVDAARLSSRRLGAVGAEVPAVDLIDPRQVPRRTGQPERAGDQALGAKPSPGAALVTVPPRPGMR